MLNNMFQGMFDNSATVIGIQDFMVCILVSLLIGGFLAWVYSFRSNYTGSFVITLAMLPAIVCMVIFKLTYNITLKDIAVEKKFIDELRCRNGNLEISISRQEVNINEL